MSAQNTAGPFSGFLGNGAWMLAIHTKRCARMRRRVVPSERIRSLVPSRAGEYLFHNGVSNYHAKTDRR